MTIKKKPPSFAVNNISFLNFAVLSQPEAALVLRWRNHPSVRSFMFTDSPISKKQHQEFINSRTTSNSSLYWLAQREKQYLGVLSLTNISAEHHHAYLGIYTNPEQKIAHAGTDILNGLIHFASNNLHLHTIKLEVMTSNTRAISFYQKMGFVEEGTLKEFVWRNGLWEDVLIMGLLLPSN